MAVLGIIICETLELEFAYLLANDHEIDGITVLENAASGRLIQALESKGIRNMQRIPHIKSFRLETSRNLEVLVRVLELSLHGRRNTLRRAVASAAREMAACADSLLLGYGLCGNAFEDMKELLNVNMPVFVPMDNGHPVDDCVGLLLGGRDCYYAEQRKVAGTFFMTPGWTSHWRKIFNKDFCGGAPDMLNRIFAGYRRSLLIVTPVMDEDEMKLNTAEFNQKLGLRVEACQGTVELLTRAWQSAKASLSSVKGGYRRQAWK
jgi:hypothetical protein